VIGKIVLTMLVAAAKINQSSIVPALMNKVLCAMFCVYNIFIGYPAFYINAACW